MKKVKFNLVAILTSFIIFTLILFDVDPNIIKIFEDLTANEKNAKTNVDFKVYGTSSSYAIVSKVIDGDTIELNTGEKVRYIGINTPEIDKECFSQESFRANSDLVLNKEVRLIRDYSETDRFGRLLRYVYIGDTFVNEYLVKNGFAESKPYPPDITLQESFNFAERIAKEENIGFWKSCTLEGQLKGDSINLEECVIKGNISSSSGNKIYHLPNCKNYFDTKIDETSGEKYFCTQEEAISAGWRKSKDCP